MNRREIEEFMRFRDPRRLKEDIELLKNARNINKEFPIKNAKAFLEETLLIRKDPFAKEALQGLIDLKRDSGRKEAFQTLIDLKRDSSMKGVLSDLLKPKSNLDSVKAFLLDRSIKNSSDSSLRTFISLAASMGDVLTESDDVEEAVLKFETIVEKKLESIPSKGFFRENFLQIASIFLSLILFIYQINDSNRSTEKIFQVLERIENNTFKAKTSEGIEIYYVVQRKAAVKNHPSFKSLTVDRLWPNARVRLLKSNHKWLYIEYMDYFEVVPKNGWVSKKYLKRLESR